MPTAIIPVSVFDTAIPLPDDGEAVNRASLVQFAQPSVNRSEFLKDKVQNTNQTIFRSGAATASAIVLGTTDTLVNSYGSPLGGAAAGDRFTIHFSARVSMLSGTPGLTSVTATAYLDGALLPGFAEVEMDALFQVRTLSWVWFAQPGVVSPTPSIDIFMKRSTAVNAVSALSRGASVVIERPVGAIP